MQQPDWYYDDQKQVGLDFEDPAVVARYDAAQNTDLAAERALAERLAWREDLVAADFGCGTGALAAALAERCAEAWAVDISASMLAVARKRAGALGLANLRTLRGGFLTAPLAEASLDLITSKYALHHLPDFWKAAALARFHRLLKPGGRLYLADVVFACPPAGLAEAVEGWAAWMQANTAYSREEVATHVRDEHSTFDWILTGLIERAGFRLLEAEHDGTVYGSYLAEKV